MKIYHKWTEEEKNFILDNYNYLTYKEIAEKLNLPYRSVFKCAHRLGIRISKEEAVKKLLRVKTEVYHDFVSEHNANWKCGVSKNHYHYKKLQVERYPEKINARKKVSRAVKTGKLIKQSCEKCGELKTQAHHDDYTKPLDIRWLCRKCHKMEHDNLH